VAQFPAESFPQLGETLRVFLASEFDYAAEFDFGSISSWTVSSGCEPEQAHDDGGVPEEGDNASADVGTAPPRREKLDRDV
jgi:hypothetical protein